MTDQPQDPKNTIFSDEEHLVLDHNYDGIQELDHPLPRWWVYLFYISIVFAVFYAGYYMLGPGPTLREELAVALKKIDDSKAPSTAGAETDETFITWAKDDAHVKAGEQIFTSKCAACHGDKGQGIVGPNLTDDHWIHGSGKVAALANVIREGVLDKGMPPWNQLLTPDEIKNALAYVIKIHGSNPPGAKAPQGDKAEWKIE